MPMLHDPSFLSAAKTRLQTLRPNDTRRWGEMSPDQMLWHVNSALENALGRLETTAPIEVPLPKAVLRFLVISVPWRKGKTPTAPQLRATSSYDFEQERARTLRLIDEFAARPLDSPWGESAILGAMSGTAWSRLQGKHVDYHLKQFGR